MKQKKEIPADNYNYNSLHTEAFHTKLQVFNTHRTLQPKQLFPSLVAPVKNTFWENAKLMLNPLLLLSNVLNEENSADKYVCGW